MRGLGRVGRCLSIGLGLLAVGCGASRPTERPLASHGSSEPVQFLPGGMRTIARGRAPGAAGYSVLAERYRFQRRTYFNLAVNVREIGGGSQGTNFTPEPSRPFTWTTQQGCSPSASMWTIVFGVLADPHDRAYAYTAHGRHRLRTATIPARFQATGVAAYVAVSEQPSEMLVTNAAGGTLMREVLETTPPERCRPGTAIMILRKRSHRKTS